MMEPTPFVRGGTRGHPRAQAIQTRETLQAGLAELPFTTPKQFLDLAWRSRGGFRILYLVQGSRMKKLPAEYAALKMDGRDMLFTSYKQPGAEQEADVIYFPKSNIGDGRNMLYLAAREQEQRQGWLYNYVVMMDDDVEFEIYDPTYQRRKLHLTKEQEAANAQAPSVSDVMLVRRRSGLRILRDELADFEQWLRFMQPAMAALCWGGSGCTSSFYHASTCHTDHKFVAYHREALETLLPMPTHRDDEGCWWASQFIGSLETTVHYRGRYLYYPGDLRIKSRASKLEVHAKYPRALCGAEQSDKLTPALYSRGLFGRIYLDLKMVLEHQAWQDGDMQCLDDLVTRCRRRGHGTLDVFGTIGKRHLAYYWHHGVSSFVPPCDNGGGYREDQGPDKYQHWGSTDANFSVWHNRMLVTVILPDRQAKGPVLGEDMEVRVDTAKPCQRAEGEQLYFLFAMTPPRAHRLEKVLETMRRQSRPPDAVILSLPRQFRRFQEPFQPLPGAASDPLLRINALPRDEGPLSKYFGGLHLPNLSTVIIGDDDMFYGASMVEDLACAVAKAPYGTVYSAGIDLSFTGLGPSLMGFRGVGMRAGMLRDLLLWDVPPECFLVDDAFASHVFFNKSGYELRKLKLRDRHAFAKVSQQGRHAAKASSLQAQSLSRLNDPLACARRLVREGVQRMPSQSAARAGRLQQSSGFAFGGYAEAATGSQ